MGHKAEPATIERVHISLEVFNSCEPPYMDMD